MGPERCLRVVVLAIPMVLLANAFRPDVNDGSALGAFNNVVVTGDSRVKEGISPASMRSVLRGQSILNFGYDNAGMNPDYITAAAQKLDTSREQPTLVLGISPFSLSPRAGTLYQTGQPTGLERSLQMSARTVGGYFEPYRMYDLLESRQHFPDGWRAYWTEQINPLQSQEHYRTNFTGNAVSAKIVSELAESVRVLSGRGIRVVAFRMPAYPGLQQLEDELSGFREVEIAEQLKAAGAAWLKFDASRYRYYDGSHMPAESAQRFSVDLAEAIQKP
jgi:hypothetical protein